MANKTIKNMIGKLKRNIIGVALAASPLTASAQTEKTPQDTKQDKIEAVQSTNSTGLSDRQVEHLKKSFEKFSEEEVLLDKVADAARKSFKENDLFREMTKKEFKEKFARLKKRQGR